MRRKRLIERPLHVTNASPAVTQVFAEASRNHGPDGRRYGTEIGFLFDDRGEHIRVGMASKGPGARQHLEQDDPESPYIGAPVCRQATGLLRRYICRGSEDHSV